MGGAGSAKKTGSGESKNASVGIEGPITCEVVTINSDPIVFPSQRTQEHNHQNCALL